MRANGRKEEEEEENEEDEEENEEGEVEETIRAAKTTGQESIQLCLGLCVCKCVTLNLEMPLLSSPAHLLLS